MKQLRFPLIALTLRAFPCALFDCAEARLVGNVADYMLGATAVVALFLHSHVLNLAAHVDSLQAALQREIDGVVGRDRLPCWADHVHMPLTMATIWEMYRWKAVHALRCTQRVRVTGGLEWDDMFPQFFLCACAPACNDDKVYMKNVWVLIPFDPQCKSSRRSGIR
ncbi:hypothetical protein HPB48_014788 [Haemaphysalis longicornis]|uniref:Uncharacterized protein n=1 Tax=Haemaphysalis longicornis TaxID=44386 RepID=A0A9J6GFQ0_HAELO|nr:hypothetical protein HPB48_014788 [Haemaphysalis longicornis]